MQSQSMQSPMQSQIPLNVRVPLPLLETQVKYSDVQPNFLNQNEPTYQQRQSLPQQILHNPLGPQTDQSKALVQESINRSQEVVDYFLDDPQPTSDLTEIQQRRSGQTPLFNQQTPGLPTYLPISFPTGSFT